MSEPTVTALVDRARLAGILAIIGAYLTGSATAASLWLWVTSLVAYLAAWWICLRSLRKAQRLHQDQTAKLMLVISVPMKDRKEHPA